MKMYGVGSLADDNEAVFDMQEPTMLLPPDVGALSRGLCNNGSNRELIASRIKVSSKY